MSENHSTNPTPAGKPAKPGKPYPDFPLTAHPAGYWCKKIRGRLYYFGPWDNPDDGGQLARPIIRFAFPKKIDQNIPDPSGWFFVGHSP
jgi:hypothetical protein